jgi:hypothetical protein
MTAELGFPSRAFMTPLLPALSRLQTGFKKPRRRAPVSDRPVVGLLAELSVPF